MDGTSIPAQLEQDLIIAPAERSPLNVNLPLELVIY